MIEAILKNRGNYIVLYGTPGLSNIWTKYYIKYFLCRALYYKIMQSFVICCSFVYAVLVLLYEVHFKTLCAVFETFYAVLM